MGKDIEVDGKLKVKKDAHFKEDVNIHECLKAEGSLNFGRTIYQQYGTISNAVVTGTSSGIIQTISGPATTQGAIYGSFAVSSPRVKPTSTVILSIDGLSGTTTGIPYAVVSGISDNLFVISIYNLSVTTSSTDVVMSIGYIIC